MADDDPRRLSVAEIENLRMRCELRGTGPTASEFRLPEVELLRAMVGLAAPYVVSVVRPKLAPLLAPR